MRPALGPTISGLPLFSALTIAEAEDLASHSEVLRLGDGDRLFTEGDLANDLFVVLSGQIRVSCRGPEGVEVVVGTIGAGHVVGEMGVLDPSPRSATASSLGGAVLLRIDGDAFARMIDAGHPAAWSIIREIRHEVCARMRRVDERVDALFTAVEQGAGAHRTDATLGNRLRAVWMAIRGYE